MPNVTLNWSEPEPFNTHRRYGHLDGVVAVFHLYAEDVCYPYPRNQREVNGGNRIFYVGGTLDLGETLVGFQQKSHECVARQLARGRDLLLSHARLSYAEVERRRDDRVNPREYTLEDYVHTVAALLYHRFARSYESPPLCNLEPADPLIENVALVQNVDVLRELDCEPLGY
jgi:hypothetical protein